MQAVRNENRHDPKTADYALTFIAYRRGRSTMLPVNRIYCASQLCLAVILDTRSLSKLFRNEKPNITCTIGMHTSTVSNYSNLNYLILFIITRHYKYRQTMFMELWAAIHAPGILTVYEMNSTIKTMTPQFTIAKGTMLFINTYFIIVVTNDCSKRKYKYNYFRLCLDIITVIDTVLPYC